MIAGARLLAWVLLLLAVPLYAHEQQPGLLNLEQLDDRRWAGRLTLPVTPGRTPAPTVETRCDLDAAPPRQQATVVVRAFTLDCPDGLDAVALAGLEHTLMDVVVTVRASEQPVRRFLLDGRRPGRVLGTVTPATPVYLRIGIEHLLFGPDHLLFVLLLIPLVRSGWRLLQLVTSFTLAHSLTLGLAATGWVRLPAGPVEALIALSIVLLAAEALERREPTDAPGPLARHPLRLTFGFGLLHGLGFAGALAQIGLPADQTVAALLLFNVGIEIGQVVVLLLALAVIRAARRALPGLPLQALRAGFVGVAGVLAADWFVARAVGVVV